MRIVQERLILAGAGRLRSGETASGTKAYFDRVAKYVPAEVISAYISANGVATLSKHTEIIFYLIFFVCLIFTPIYITRFATTKKESWTNGIMASIAFVVWAYATGGGLVKHIGWYDAPTASVILVLFTLASGAIEPVKKQEPPKPEIMEIPPSTSTVE